MIKKTIVISMITLLFIGVVPLSINVAYSPAPYPELRGIWRFDEGTGTTAYDTSGNGNDGTLNGTTLPTWNVAGKYGKALNFSGDDFVDVPDSDSLDVVGAITIEAWVYPQKTAGIIAMKYNHSSLSSSYYLGFGGVGGNKFQFSLSYNGNNYYTVWSSTNVTLQTWTHVAAVMNGTHMLIYQNGVFDGSLAYPPGTIFAGTSHLRFGCYLPEAGYPRYFNGSIDEVKIFSYARSLPFTQWNVDDDKVQKPDADFMSIEEACMAAAPRDTISVYPGTYQEAIRIDKSLKVLGSGADTTIIEGTGVSLSDTGLVRITASSGTVQFSGFTVQNAGPVGPSSVRIGILTQSSLAGPTYTISDNKIYGSNNPDEAEDYGFYASYGKENLIFTNNVISQTGANNMVLEVHTGATEISHNTLDAGVYGTDAIFFMTYNAVDVTTIQNVSYNTFDMGTGGVFDYSHRSTGISFNSPGPAWGLTEAKFTRMTIVGNTLNNLQNDRRGIGFWNAGTGDNLQSPVISNNAIHGVPGSTGTYGIDFYGLTTNAYLSGNTIDGCAVGVALRSGTAPGTVLRNNNIIGNTVGVDWTIGTTGPVDARFNWWGSITGPNHTTTWTYLGLPYGPNLGSGDPVTDYVIYGPWTGLAFPVISIQPTPVQKQILNTTFDINVTITNLSVWHRAYGVEFRLCYDDTLLEVVSVTEGPFMKDPRWNLHGTYFIYFIETHPTYGPSIICGDLVLPDAADGQCDAFPYGNGTLATITFRVIKQERGLEKPPLSCGLTLRDSMITTDFLDEIPHFLNSGEFMMYPTHIGDVNFDGKVDMVDIAMVARAFMTKVGDPGWNPALEIIDDGIINMADIAHVAQAFNWHATYP